MRNTTTTAIAAASVILLGLVGCSVAPPERIPVATPTAWEPILLEGVTEATMSLTVPSGARSLTVVIDCPDSFGVNMSTGADTDDRTVECGSGRPTRLPVSPATRTLQVFTGPDAEFTLVGEYGTDRVDVDSVIQEQCDAFSTARSIEYTASLRLYRGAIDANRWNALLRDAAAAVAQVPTSGSPRIAESLPAVQQAYETTALRLGGLPDWSAAPGYAAASLSNAFQRFASIAPR
jgi:hypothetical protein